MLKELLKHIFKHISNEVIQHLFRLKDRLQDSRTSLASCWFQRIVSPSSLTTGPGSACFLLHLFLWFLSTIFDARGIKAEEGKPKVETLDLVCCDQTVRSSLPFIRMLTVCCNTLQPDSELLSLPFRGCSLRQSCPTFLGSHYLM